MNIVRIKIVNNELNISYIEDDKLLKKFVNTNKISNNKLLYSFNYLSKKKNLKNVYNALYEFTNFDKINKVIFEDNEVATNILFIFNYIKHIFNFEFKEEKSLNKNLIIKIKSLYYIKSLICYFIPEDYIHY